MRDLMCPEMRPGGDFSRPLQVLIKLGRNMVWRREWETVRSLSLSLIARPRSSRPPGLVVQGKCPRNVALMAVNDPDGLDPG